MDGPVLILAVIIGYAVGLIFGFILIRFVIHLLERFALWRVKRKLKRGDYDNYYGTESN